MAVKKAYSVIGRRCARTIVTLLLASSGGACYWNSFASEEKSDEDRAKLCLVAVAYATDCLQNPGYRSVEAIQDCVSLAATICSN